LAAYSKHLKILSVIGLDDSPEPGCSSDPYLSGRNS
jgi:hypothetical protein